MNKYSIGCDIGGVIRNSIESNPINHAIESILELSKTYEIIFISKCKDDKQLNCRNWMKENGLGEFKIIFCYEYSDKARLAVENNISIFIDDKIQVLSKFNNDILKIWLCSDEKKINGTKFHQPDLYNTLKLATNWSELTEIIKENF